MSRAPINYMAFFGSTFGTLEIEFQAPERADNAAPVVEAARKRLASIVYNADLWSLNDIRKA